MKWTVVHCDILDRPADVLVLSGNPQLNLSGGTGGAFLMRYGDEMQHLLHAHLTTNNIQFVDRTTVIQMPPCGSPYVAVLHAVGIDAFYDSNCAAITATITKSLELAANLNARTVAMAAIGTGYGKLALSDFAAGVKPIVRRDFYPIEHVDICLKKSEAVSELAKLIPVEVA